MRVGIRPHLVSKRPFFRNISPGNTFERPTYPLCSHPLVLSALIDKNSDGIIDYQEFMPVCFSMIVEILSDKVCRS